MVTLFTREIGKKAESMDKVQHITITPSLPMKAHTKMAKRRAKVLHLQRKGQLLIVANGLMV